MRSQARFAFPGYLGKAAATLALVLVISSPALAGLLSFDVIAPDRFGPADTTYVFSGSITNNTGNTLNATDIFVDINGYDAGVVSPLQLLGVPDFPILDGVTTAVIELFSLTIGANALGGITYLADVGLSDVFNNLSDIVTVSVTVPEPSSGLLLVLGGLLVVFLRRGAGAAPALSR